MAHETIITNGQITIDGESHTVKVDHMLDVKDDQDQYTGCYRATIDKYQIVNVEINNDAIWVESETKEPTDLSRAIGKLIENYSE